ncbi:MAG: hypothetical protein WDA41_10010 [Candidatus Neomarinimicrobiota bacterium]
MTSRDDDFAAKLEVGKDGERVVAARLLRRGCSVLPLYQFDADRAPSVLSGDQRIVLPDLLCWPTGGGEQFFVEVKLKHQWVRWNGRRETGFSARLLPHYQAVQTVTGSSVYVAFVHEVAAPLGIFVADLARLIPLRREWDGLSPSGQRVSEPLTLFPADALRELL